MSAINSIRLIRESRAHGTTASTSSHDDGEDDHLVKDAAELVAAAHLADRHEVGIDHAGQLSAWTRLKLMRKADQSMQSILLIRGGDHVDSSHGATFMKLVCESGVESSPQTYLPVRRNRAVQGQAVDASPSRVRDRKLVLRFVYILTTHIK